MTALQLQYRQLQEQQRSNLAKEQQARNELTETQFKNRSQLEVDKRLKTMQGLEAATRSALNVQRGVFTVPLENLNLVTKGITDVTGALLSGAKTVVPLISSGLKK